MGDIIDEYASLQDEATAGASVGQISIETQAQNAPDVLDEYADSVPQQSDDEFISAYLPQEQASVVTPETQAASQQALADKFKHPADLAAEQQVSAQINPDRSVWENAKLACGRGKEDYTLKTMAADAIISGDQAAALVGELGVRVL